MTIEYLSKQTSNYTILQGTVIKSTGSWYDVRLEDESVVNCRVKGKFRLEDLKTTNPLAVGDKVVIEMEDTGTAVVVEILPRENYLIRQSPKKKSLSHIIAANIDLGILIATLKKPRTSQGFIDRYLISMESYEIPSCIIFNKSDIYNKKDLAKYDEIASLWNNLGYPCYLVSATEKKGIETIIELLKDKITLATGHSGVGKSTLINAIHPGLELKIGEISRHTRKGMHITTYAEMFELPRGGFIIDTPGMKEFGITNMELREVSYYFREMKDLLEHCRFNNCLHINEPDCAVIEAVNMGNISASRYKSYLSIIDSLES